MITLVRRGTRPVPGSPGPHRSHGFRRIEASSSRPSPAEQLRTLARVVERLGLNGRFDPEAAFIERDELAHALRRLADRLEHQSGQPPTAAPGSTSQAVLPRRFAAVLAAKASEIAEPAGSAGSGHATGAPSTPLGIREPADASRIGGRQ